MSQQCNGRRIWIERDLADAKTQRRKVVLIKPPFPAVGETVTDMFGTWRVTKVEATEVTILPAGAIKQ